MERNVKKKIAKESKVKKKKKKKKNKSLPHHKVIGTRALPALYSGKCGGRQGSGPGGADASLLVDGLPGFLKQGKEISFRAA